MNPFIGASLISGGASLVGGLLGIGASKSSNGYSFRAQKKLMDLQQQYARENSATQYERQRELTADSWLLNKQGMRNAGLNPAFMDGSSNATASAPETAAPANGSVNVTTPDLSGVVQNGVQNLIAIQNSKADNRLKDSQSALNETKQMTAFSEALADLRIKKANASSAEVKAEIDNSLKDLRKQYEAMSIKNQALLLDNERAMSDVKTFYTPQELFTHLQTMKAQLQQSYYAGLINKKEYESYDKRLSAQLLESSARTNLDRAKALTEGTLQNLNNANVGLVHSQTDLNVIEHYIKDASKEDVIELAHRQVQEHGPQSVSEDMWSIFNNWDHATGWQRMRALGEIVPSLATDFWSGASNSAGAAFGTKAGPEQNTYHYHEYTNNKGDHSVYTRKKVKNYKPSKH